VKFIQARSASEWIHGTKKQWFIPTRSVSEGFHGTLAKHQKRDPSLTLRVGMVASLQLQNWRVLLECVFLNQNQSFYALYAMTQLTSHYSGQNYRAGR
jgi:hypothetical protein